MRLSDFEDAESAVEAYRYELRSLELVRAASAGGLDDYTDVVILKHRCIAGAFGEPRDLEAFSKLERVILDATEVYLLTTIAQIREELESLNVTID